MAARLVHLDDLRPFVRHHQRMRWTDLQLRAVAVAVTVAAFLLTAAAAALHLRWDDQVELQPLAAGDVVLAVMYPAAGLLVLWHRPRNPAGWVLLSAALVSVSVLSHQWSEIALAEPGSLPLVGAAIWFSAWTFVPYWAQPSLLPVLFPDGRLPSAAWRRYLQVVLGLLAVLVLTAMFKADEDVEGLGGSNPLGAYWLFERLPPAVGPVLQYGSGLLLWLVCSPVAVAGLLRRQRTATGVERTQLQWLLLGLIGCVVLTVGDFTLGETAGEVLFATGFALVPISVSVAVLRHGLFDVEVVVNRTIAYALLTGTSLLAYVVLVAVATRYGSGDGAGPVVAALVVAAAASGRSRLQRLVDRRLFGARRDPYALVQQVGESTAAAAAPGEALHALVDAVRSALRLPFVQVLDDAGDSVSRSGQPVVGTHVVPVQHAGRRLGTLVVGRRSRRERLLPAEASALSDVARRAGALLAAQRLDLDLERSYAQVLEVREQERRRLRRDLHDGVGPSLAGVALQLESLSARLSEPALAARADHARERLLSVVSDVRLLVDGLRPEEVEQQGLATALRRLATDEDDRVRVAVQVDPLPLLPSELEVAAYRIAGEAVTNALRHAGARVVHVAVRLADDALLVDVRDDGGGLPVPVQPGVGLQSMQERATELGGHCDVGPGTDGGTRVLARLPLQRRP